MSVEESVSRLEVDANHCQASLVNLPEHDVEHQGCVQTVRVAAQM